MVGDSHCGDIPLKVSAENAADSVTHHGLTVKRKLLVALPVLYSFVVVF